MATALGNITISNVAVGGSAATALALGDVIVWQLGPEPVAATPLCFTAEGSNASVALMHGSGAPSINMEYSVDNTTWNSYTLGTTVTLASKGDKVYFRAADVNAGMGFSGGNYWQAMYNNWFDCQNVSVSGKIVSLLRKDMDDSLTYTDRDGIYRCMFRNYNNRNPHLVSARDLQLPQLSAFSTQAFMAMFTGSTLSAAPALPTNCSLKKETFGFFFENCDNLSSIGSPMMTITGLSNITASNDPALGNIFTDMNNFNQEELVVALSGIADYPNYSLGDVFRGNTSFTGKFIFDMTSYTTVPTIQSSTFNSNTKPANGTFEIRVPASLYDTWKNATNWTTWSSYIVPVS